MKDQARALRGIDIVRMTADAVARNEEAVLDANRRQMMEGQGVNAQQFKPYYTDPVWQGNMKKAAAYSRYKDSLGLGTPSGIPNMYITGETHRDMVLTVSGTKFTITSRVPWAGRISSWQNGNVFGLTQQSMDELWQTKIGAEVADQFYRKLGI